MDKQNVIISPIVTEKAMKASEGGKYSFIVASNASKTDIKIALKSIYKVNALDVQTTMIKGRKIRTGMRRIEVAKPVFKKAVVKLKKDQKITAFDPGATGEEAKKEKKKK
jgi:large subunit ribosomal protein L23